MPYLVEGTHAGEFILWEPHASYSRENVTVIVPAATTLPAGAVLVEGVLGWAPMTAETAVEGANLGILYAPLTNDGAAPANMAGVVIDKVASVRGADLDWNSQAQAVVLTAMALLRAQGVLVRDYTPPADAGS
ncbi:MAG: head decoration protein [Candidatus Methylomirabilales bacterium]